MLAVGIEAVRSPSPLVAVAWVAFAAQLHWMLRRIGSFRWWTAALFPVAALAFVGLFVAVGGRSASGSAGVTVARAARCEVGRPAS